MTNSEIITLEQEQISLKMRTAMRENKLQLVGVICKNGEEFPVIICPTCKCPRFVDYACDTCAKRGMESDYRDFQKKVSRLKTLISQF